jgi:hypothetical protein
MSGVTPLTMFEIIVMRHWKNCAPPPSPGQR